MEGKLNHLLGKILLEKSRIISQYSISKDNPVLKESYFKKLINKEVNNGIVKEIDKIVSEPTFEVVGDQHIFRKELYIFSVKYFHQVVRSIIQMMSDEQINKIRSENYE